MADESILTYKKPGFPQTVNSEKSYVTRLEYVGPKATLEAAQPTSNSSWGNYSGRVRSTELTPTESGGYAELAVELEYFYDDAGNAGTAREVSYEVEWHMFSRPLLEHPTFRSGGGGAYALSAQDIVNIEKWQNEPDTTKRSIYKFDDGTGTYKTLSTAARKYAIGLQLGQDQYEDYAPVVRRITTYTGGPPSSTDAGRMMAAPAIPGQPNGYEWRKSADRAIRAGGQTRWERTEEWVGAKKVLSDKDRIFW